jgi:exopolysaccharide biosynthesis polyprenyl glycosylphosphotransferase
MSIATEEAGVGAALNPVERTGRIARLRSLGSRQGSAAAVALPLGLREGRSLVKPSARDGLYRRALMLSDAVAAVLALAFVLSAAGERVEPIVLAAAPLMVLASRVSGLYGRDELVLHKTTLDEAPALFRLGGVFTLVVWLVHGQAATLGPGHLVLLWAASRLLLLVDRGVARAAAARLVVAERCLVIGDPASVTTLREKLKGSRANAEVTATLTLGADAPALDLSELRQTVGLGEIDRVIIAPTSTAAAEVLEAIRLAQVLGLRVSLVPGLLQVVGSGVEFDEIDGLTALGVRRFGLDRSSRVIKRAFDLVASTLAILVLAPLMAVIAAAIVVDSPGPILFRQLRVGRDGRRFEILKFRSMVEDAEARKATVAHLNEARGLFKIADDPRITASGRILRRFCLDELPQLFNVWRGEMSLVGPRPLVVDEDALIVGLDRSRLHLTPGMTGHWQVLGSTRIPMHEMVLIDYLYIANWSLWADVKLLLRTVPLVLSRSGV